MSAEASATTTPPRGGPSRVSLLDYGAGNVRSVRCVSFVLPSWFHPRIRTLSAVIVFVTTAAAAARGHRPTPESETEQASIDVRERGIGRGPTPTLTLRSSIHTQRDRNAITALGYEVHDITS